MSKSVTMFVRILETKPEIARNPGRCIDGLTHLRLSVSYSLGGMNYWTYKQEPRGYYLHITPEKHDTSFGYGVTSTALGSGCKMFLHAVNRQSEKQMKIAVDEARENAQKLVDWCKEEYGIIAEPVTEYFKEA